MFSLCFMVPHIRDVGVTGSNPVTYLSDRYRLLALQVLRRVHPLMQHANDRDTVIRDAKVNHMPLDIAAAVSLTNMFTG